MDDRDQWGGALGRGLRGAAGVLLGGGLGAVTWLTVMHQPVQRGWGDHDFLRSAGALLGADAASATKAGFLLAVVTAGVVALLVAVLDRRLPRSLAAAGLMTGAAILVLWGGLFGPIAGSRVPERPAGVLGLDGGYGSAAFGVVASALAGIVIVRVVRVCAGADWWRPWRTPEAPGAIGSFELPEERGEQRVVGSR